MTVRSVVYVFLFLLAWASASKEDTVTEADQDIDELFSDAVDYLSDVGKVLNDMRENKKIQSGFSDLISGKSTKDFFAGVLEEIMNLRSAEDKPEVVKQYEEVNDMIKGILDEPSDDDDIISALAKNMNDIMKMKDIEPSKYKEFEMRGKMVKNKLRLRNTWHNLVEEWGFPNIDDEALAKLSAELSDTHDIFYMLQRFEHYGKFKITEFIEPILNKDFRQELLETVFPLVKVYLQVLTSEKVRQKIFEKAFNALSTFYVNTGKSPLNQKQKLNAVSEVLYGTISRILMKVYPLALTLVSRKLVTEYVKTVADYYNEIVKSSVGQRYLDMGEMTDEKLEERFVEIVGEDMIVPIINSWKSVELATKFPKCAGYILCTLNSKKFLGTESEIKTAFVVVSSKLAGDHLVSESNLSEDTNYYAIQSGFEGMDCKKLFSATCDVKLKQTDGIIYHDVLRHEL